VSLRAFPHWLFLSACVVIPSAASAQAAAVRIQEEYEWPGLAVLRCSVREGDLLLVLRAEQQASGNGIGHSVLALGAGLSWLRFGPLLPRGMLRMVADPLSFSAWSGVFDERTGLVLDSALRTPRVGVLLMPVAEYCGLFCRRGGAGDMEYGAFGRLPLGTAAAAECVLLASRPDPAAAPDDWYLARSPFPGGDLTHFAARFVLDSPSLDFSCAAGASSARFAAPGAFSTLWLRGRLPELEGALLLSGATPGYRAPDGTGTVVASRFSGTVRLGGNRRRGSIEAGFSFAAAEPGFSPGREIPTKNVLRAAFSRDSTAGSSCPVSLLLDAEKEVSRDSNGVRYETSRCSATAGFSMGLVDLAAGAGVSDNEGVNLFGRLNAMPSARFRLAVEAKGRRLCAQEPAGSMIMRLIVQGAERSATLEIGLQDFPLNGSISRPAAEFLMMKLSYSVVFP
jgi:hypothetical protein